MVKVKDCFIPYPDVIAIKVSDQVLILESREVREYCYSLTCYIEDIEDKVSYEYFYHPWGCSPCGGSSPCETCEACSQGRPHMSAPEFFKKLRSWIDNEKRNRGLPRISIRGKP